MPVGAHSTQPAKVLMDALLFWIPEDETFYKQI